MKPLAISLIVLTSLALLIYPFLLFAILMSLAAEPSANDSFALLVAKFGFLWGSASYPLPYLVSLIASIRNLKKNNIRKALMWQLALLGYVLLMGLFFVAWVQFEKY